MDNIIPPEDSPIAWHRELEVCWSLLLFRLVIIQYLVQAGGLPKVSGITEGKGARVMLADIPG